MSALNNNGQYDVCSCEQCSGIPKVNRNFIYYNPKTNQIKIYARNKNGWYGYVGKGYVKEFELFDILIGQFDD